MADPESLRQEDAATRQVWAAMMLSSQVDVCESILEGRPVLVRQLDQAALRRALRGAPAPRDSEYITVTLAMLAAVHEGGAFGVMEDGLTLRERKR